MREEGEGFLMGGTCSSETSGILFEGIFWERTCFLGEGCGCEVVLSV